MSEKNDESVENDTPVGNGEKIVGKDSGGSPDKQVPEISELPQPDVIGLDAVTTTEIDIGKQISALSSAVQSMRQELSQEISAVAGRVVAMEKNISAYTDDEFNQNEDSQQKTANECFSTVLNRLTNV